MIGVLGSGLISAAGRQRADVVARLRAGDVAPSVVELPDLGLGGRFLYYPVTDIPPGQDRILEFMAAAAANALAEADLGEAARRRVGVFVGSSSMDLPEAEAWVADHPGAAAILHPQHGGGILSRRLAERFGLRGGAYSFSAACSSAVCALLAAVDQIEAGLIDHALVVGVETFNQTALHGFNSLQLLSSTGCRPFTAERDGMVLGEGAAAVVLGRDAGRWRLLGGESRIDAGNITRASTEGMLDTLRAALAAAHLAPADIRAVKAHASATAGNDDAEAEALTALFATAPPRAMLKPALGYTLGASGLMELVALGWCAEAGFLPGGDVSAPAGPYLLNCFGFGGNNTAVVVDYAAA